MKSAMKSDIGRHREVNEDACLSTVIDGSYIYIVADGMGGHMAGEVASQLAIDSILNYINDHSQDLASCVEIINSSISYANEIIYKKSKSPEYKDMGTTCELVIVRGSKAYIGHVGDSRVYIKSEESFNQVTRDHSLVNDLLDSGSISEYEADRIGQKNIITRALGGEEEINSDIHELDLNQGDILLICTDGITGELSDHELDEILSSDADLESKAEELIRQSNKAGGYDNSTVILAEKR